MSLLDLQMAYLCKMTGLCSDHSPYSPFASKSNALSQLSDISNLKAARGRIYSSLKHWPEWGISLPGKSVRGTWREGSFTGGPERYAK